VTELPAARSINSPALSHRTREGQGIRFRCLIALSLSTTDVERVGHLFLFANALCGGSYGVISNTTP
jgi:hypothetical protein